MRLFVAVWPSDEVVATLAGLDRPSLRGLRWTPRQQWHVTLRFLGNVPVGDVEAVVAALESVSVAAPVRAVMGPVTARFAQRILHVPVAGLESLASGVLAATAELGEPPEDRPFFGHITLARVRPRSRIDLRSLCGVPLAGEWPVRQLTLVASHPDPSGARYEVIAARNL